MQKMRFELQQSQPVLLVHKRQQVQKRLFHQETCFELSRCFILEMIMNAKHVIGTMGFLCATIAGSAFAGGGTYGSTNQSGELRTFDEPRLTLARSDVQAELRKASGQGTSASIRDGEDATAPGAHGVAGSRYSMMTREEVRTGFSGDTSHRGSIRDTIYFGD
jgi:hypothetical protein